MSNRVYVVLLLHALVVGLGVGIAAGSMSWGCAAASFCVFLPSLVSALKDKP